MVTSNIDLKGKVALVTGASRGIGRAIAVSLAEHGARVALHYRAERQAAETTLAALDQTGGRHVLLAADLADPEAALTLADRAVAEAGRLDMVINNAGIYERHPVADSKAADWRRQWDRTLAVNLSGPAHVIHGALPHLRSAGGGHIVNISSRGAFRGEPEAPAYGASKAGLNSLSQSLAIALAPFGIHVVAIAPGWVATDMTQAYLSGPEGDAIRAQSPLGRVAAGEEIAAAVLLAVSGHCDALTGAIIDVTGASYLRS